MDHHGFNSGLQAGSDLRICIYCYEDFMLRCIVSTVVCLREPSAMHSIPQDCTILQISFVMRAHDTITLAYAICDYKSIAYEPQTFHLRGFPQPLMSR